MGSKKRSAWAKQKAAFAAGLAEGERGGGYGTGRGSFGEGGFADAFGEDGDSLADVLDGFDDVFAREDRRRAEAVEQREAALRDKACESKNRYATRAEAEENLAWCESQGRRGLHIYRCDYCGGWHLTSKPQRGR